MRHTDATSKDRALRGAGCSGVFTTTDYSTSCYLKLPSPVKIGPSRSDNIESHRYNHAYLHEQLRCILLLTSGRSRKDQDISSVATSKTNLNLPASIVLVFSTAPRNRTCLVTRPNNFAVIPPHCHAKEDDVEMQIDSSLMVPVAGVRGVRPS